MTSELGPTTAIQRSKDPQEQDTWLIQTRAGSFVGRFYPDGRRIFFRIPRTGAYTEDAWRPWTDADRPLVDRVWQSFFTWWTERGGAWPPD